MPDLIIKIQKFILVLCLSSAISLQGQQFKVNLSSPVDIKNDVVDFHKYGNHLYSDKTNWGKMQFALTANLKKVNYGVELTQYDDQFKELKTLSLDNGAKDFGPFSPLVHYGEMAIYVMYFRFVDDDKVKMFVAKVNPDDLTLVATKEVMEYNQKNQAYWGTLKTINEAQFFYTVSEDGKNAWIVHASPKLIISSVIDGDLNLVQKTESTPVKLENLLVTGAYIGNNGNKVMVYRTGNFEEFYARGLFFQSANTKGSFAAVKYPGGYFPGNLQLKESIDGTRLFMGGEYLGSDAKFGGQGVSLAQVNISRQSVSTPAFYPYTDELKRRILNLGFASRRKGEIAFTDHFFNYKMNEMDNGTMVMSADMMTSTTSGKIIHFWTGPIVHVFIKPGGSVTMTLIPKKQPSGSVTNFFSYQFQDKIICIYGDLPRSPEKEVHDMAISLTRTLEDIVPVANIYDADGKLLLRKVLIERKKDLKGHVMIGALSFVGKNKFLFPVGETKANMVKYYASVNQFCYMETF